MVLLGITGPIGHGKTTLANYLAQQETTAQQAESGQVVAEVADRLNKFFLWEAPNENDLQSVNRWLGHLPGILESVTHSTVDHNILVLNDHDLRTQPAYYEKLLEYIYVARHEQSLLTEHITPKNKTAYRSLLQWIGGFCVTHINRGIWYNELVRRARIAESQGCQLFVIGGVRFPSDADILHAAGGKVLKITRPGATIMDKLDPTERERTSIVVDAKISNNGSLQDLMKLSVQIHADLLGNRLQSTYRARA